MPSSHHQHRHDKTVLSCWRCERSSRQSQFSVVLNILETEQFCPVSSAVWMHLWTSLDPVSKYDVTIRNHVANWKLGQDKTRLSSRRISRLGKAVSKFSVADSLDLSPIQFTPRTPTRQYKTVLSCRFQRCELAIKHSKFVSGESTAECTAHKVLLCPHSHMDEVTKHLIHFSIPHFHTVPRQSKSGKEYTISTLHYNWISHAHVHAWIICMCMYTAR